MNDTNRNPRTGESLFGITLIVLFLLFVWPGIFRYEYRGEKTDTRVDRLTHQVQILAPNGDWVKR